MFLFCRGRMFPRLRLREKTVQRNCWRVRRGSRAKKHKRHKFRSASADRRGPIAKQRGRGWPSPPYLSGSFERESKENVRRIGQHVRSTHGPRVLGNFGAFAGLFHLQDVRDPVLVASTDGVGTKVLLGLQLQSYDVL